MAILHQQLACLLAQMEAALVAALGRSKPKSHQPQDLPEKLAPLPRAVKESKIVVLVTTNFFSFFKKKKTSTML